MIHYASGLFFPPNCITTKRKIKTTMNSVRVNSAPKVALPTKVNLWILTINLSISRVYIFKPGS